MKQIYTFLIFTFACLSQAQTISFTGCPNLFANSTYIFNKTSTDGTGRNVYQTTPISGDQDCPGLGKCEFMIKWNDTASRWEFLGDSGNGDFIDPYLIYYNTSASLPNPPSVNFGIWEENNAVTNSDCGGNLTSSNATMTGAVQTVLGSEVFELDHTIAVLPNPVIDRIQISSDNTILSTDVFNMQGQQLKKLTHTKEIDFSSMQSGVYLVKIITDKGIKIQNIIKQ